MVPTRTRSNRADRCLGRTARLRGRSSPRGSGPPGYPPRQAASRAGLEPAPPQPGELDRGHMASTGGSTRSMRPAAARPGGPACRSPLPTCRAPRPGPPATTGVIGRVVHEVDHRLAGPQQSGSIGPRRAGPPSAVPAMPERGGVDHQVAVGVASSGHARPARPVRPGRRPRRARVCRPVDHHHLAGPGVGQGGDDRPGRPAGPDHQTAAPAGIEVGRRVEGRRPDPAPSVLSPPRRTRRRRTTQLTAPSRSATADRRSTRAATASLWGMVTDRPRMPRARAPARASAGAARPAPGSPPTPSRARARRRRCCADAGDSEWATGSPITPTTAVAADSRRGRRRTGALGIDASLARRSGQAALFGQGLVGLLLGEGVGEGLGAVGLHHHEVQPGPGGRVEGGLEGGPGREADRRRGQALVEVGVVRRWQSGGPWSSPGHRPALRRRARSSPSAAACCVGSRLRITRATGPEVLRDDPLLLHDGGHGDRPGTASARAAADPAARSERVGLPVEPVDHWRRAAGCRSRRGRSRSGRCRAARRGWSTPAGCQGECRVPPVGQRPGTRPRVAREAGPPARPPRPR